VGFVAAVLGIAVPSDLAINEELGRKEGMSNQYCNLDLLYQIRGELDRAELSDKPCHQ
jgi:hypothetical protein